MSELTKKILESGLVDETTAKLMEKWGFLEEGSSDLAAGKAEALERATVEKDVRETLIKMAERIGHDVDTLRRSRETMLDLNQLRWPASVFVSKPDGSSPSAVLDALIDRMGRYYFRSQDVNVKWFVPGYLITRNGNVPETILEVSELFLGDQVVAVQVSTK